MSRRLLRTLRNPRPYLHSPVDDLESFYYTAQWAAAFNDGANGGKYCGEEIEEFREMIAGGTRDSGSLIVRNAVYPVTRSQEEGYGPFFTQSLAFLSPWLAKLATIVNDWGSVMAGAKALEDEQKEKYLGLNFLVYGYRGVGEYLELVHEHRALLQEIV